jgi:hypothetical protein
MKYYVSGISLVVLVLLAWFFRYDASVSGQHSVILDRWTGTVQKCFITVCSPLPGHFSTDSERPSASR